MPRCRNARARSVAAVLSCAVVLSAGCAVKTPRALNPIADDYVSGSAYIYQPLNPTTIWVRDPQPCQLQKNETAADITSPEFKHALLRDLDTETVRISLARISGDGTATAPVVGTSVKGESYVLVIDYIKYFTSSEEVRIPRATTDATAPKETPTRIPIYAGIGVRIRAEFKALESNLNISGLPGLAVAADGKRVSGRLTVQTLGITGPDITALMPIISDLSVGSIQSAVQAVAAIKAKLYEDSSVAYPKIVGFESPTSDAKTLTRITEQLYGKEEMVVPRVSPNPMKANQPLLWIEWFPTPADRECPKAARATDTH